MQIFTHNAMWYFSFVDMTFVELGLIHDFSAHFQEMDEFEN